MYIQTKRKTKKYKIVYRESSNSFVGTKKYCEERPKLPPVPGHTDKLLFCILNVSLKTNAVKKLATCVAAKMR